MEEIKERLHEQENEIRLLKELIVKGFKGIENLSFQSPPKKFADSSTSSTAAEDSEASRSEMTSDDMNNDTENQTGPELPLPVPNLF